jgi:hypothetical protein
VRVQAIAATTDALPDRGIRLSYEALKEAVASFRPTPVFDNHGVDEIGRTLSVDLEQRPDGEWNLVVEAEIVVPEGTDPAQFLRRGWSVGLLEGHAPPGTTVTVGLDYLAFTDADVAELTEALAEVPNADVRWYHQFAAAPEPTVLVELTQAIGSILQTPAWLALERAILRLLVRRPRTGPIVFRMRGPNVKFDIQVPVNADPEMVTMLFDRAEQLLVASDQAGRKKSKK